MLEGILHQLSGRLHAELLHDRVPVKSHGARAYLEEVRDFLHRAAFREELQHFALARGKLFRGRLRGPAKEDTERHALGDQRRDAGLARERLLDSREQLRPMRSSSDLILLLPQSFSTLTYDFFRFVVKRR